MLTKSIDVTSEACSSQDLPARDRHGMSRVDRYGRALVTTLGLLQFAISSIRHVDKNKRLFTPLITLVSDDYALVLY